MPPALLPLAILEAIQNIDTPPDDGLGALQDELAAKRLGLSPTIAAQIGRYRQQARAGGDIGVDEVVGVFRLAARRPDARLVFSDAGRRAARHAARHLSLGRRVMIAALPRRASTSVALSASSALAPRWLMADLVRDDQQLHAAMQDSIAFRARDDGAGCLFYTGAFAELLRQVGGLEWTVVHEACQADGHGQCRWRAMRAEGYE